MTETTDMFEQDAQEQMATDPPQKVIKYKHMEGIEGARVITKADFKKVGVDMKDQTWSADNGWMVSADGWHPAAVELVLAQPNMKLLEA